MSPLQKQISSTISWLRLPLVLMVIFIHSDGWGDYQSHSYIDGLVDISLYDLLRTLISQILCQVAVPMFFIISGYLFYMKFERNEWNWELWRQKIKSRFYTLFIPYLSWNILRFLFNEGLRLVQSLRHGDSFASWVMVALNKVSPKIFFNIGLTDTGYINWNSEMIMMFVPEHVPFWYIRDLILMVVLSPLLWFLIKRFREAYVLTLVAMFIAMPFEYFDIRGIVFFSIGGYLQLFLQKHKIENIHISFSLLRICLMLFLMLVGINVFFRSALPLTVILGIAAIVMLSMKLYTKIKIPEQLQKSSFFIFSFHMFLVGIFNTLYSMSHIEIQNESVLIGLYLVLPIVYCMLSYATYLLVCQVPFLSLILLGRKIPK